MTDPTIAHTTPEHPEDRAVDALLDEELDDTFPASDTPSALLREPADPTKPA